MGDRSRHMILLELAVFGLLMVLSQIHNLLHMVDFSNSKINGLEFMLGHFCGITV